MEPNGKVALITGAGSGIGRATALLLAEKGASVVVADVNESGGNDLQQAIDSLAAISGASGDKTPPHDPDLTLIIERWEHLPRAVKTGIMAMVKATEGEG